MPVWLTHDSVSGLGQKHGATDDVVCAEQLVDGAKTNYSRACRMSAACAAWAHAEKVAQRGQPKGVKSVKWVSQKNGGRLVNFYQSTLAFVGVIQSFPSSELFVVCSHGSTLMDGSCT